MTARQDRFVAEYLCDLNATQAAIRAGYSVKTAKQIGSRLLTNVDVASAVAAGQEQKADDLGLTVDWVLSMLKENVLRAMQAEPVYEMRDGQKVETGEYTYQGNVANKALELIGKHRGMFPERIAMIDPQQMSEAELEKVAKTAKGKLRLIA